MEHMVIGKLAEADQEAIDEQMEVIYETDKDPFEDEPLRHKQHLIRLQPSHRLYQTRYRLPFKEAGNMVFQKSE